MSIEMQKTTRSNTESSRQLSELRSDFPETTQHVVEKDSSPKDIGLQEHDGRLDAEQDEDRFPVLTAISDPEQDRLPPLSYKPFMLALWFLICSLVLHLAVLVMLTMFYFFPIFNIMGQWSYFTIQILPVIIGTITASFLDGMALTLTRLTPFILCASSNGAFAGDTILGQYFPNPGLFEAWRTRNWLLLSAWILCFAGDWILALKASLLNTTDNDKAIITRWALIPLIVIYGLVILLILAVMWWLRHKKLTGLRWDPVSIADHLMLFRHSNILNYFEGTDLAERDSMFEALKRLRLRLGYWIRENGDIWHGFGLMETGDSKIDMVGNTDPPRKLLAKEIQDIRYRSTYFSMKRIPMYLWVAMTFALLGGFIAALSTGMKDGIELHLSYGLASFVFQFIPTFVVGLYSWFWKDISLFSRSTQPYINLISPRPASDNLLLDYNCQLPYILTYSAMKNKHWKVARVSAVALLQRFLPIILAASIQVVENDGTCTVFASLPQCIIIMSWLLIYVMIIPYEVLEAGHKRHLPRNYSSIADILSWTYASRLLREDVPDGYENGELAGNPFNALKSSRPETGRWYEGFQSERWYMEARLRLSCKEYQFGLYKSTTHPDIYCIGIDEAGTNSEAVPEQPSPPADRQAGLRRRKKTSSSVLPMFETGSAKEEKKEYLVSGDKMFVMLLKTKPESGVVMSNALRPDANAAVATQEENEA